MSINKELINWFFILRRYKGSFYWAEVPNEGFIFAHPKDNDTIEEKGIGFTLKNIPITIYPVQIMKFQKNRRSAILDLILFKNAMRKEVAYQIRITLDNIFVTKDPKPSYPKFETMNVSIKPVKYEGGFYLGWSINYFKLFLPLPSAANNGSNTAKTQLKDPFPEQRVRERIHPTYGKLRY